MHMNILLFSKLINNYQFPDFFLASGDQAKPLGRLKFGHNNFG